jgi:hypothetical protein
MFCKVTCSVRLGRPSIVVRALRRYANAFFFTVLLIVSATGSATSAQSDTAVPGPVARQILALYDGSIEMTAAETRIHRWAELPLNHLGFVLTYRDIRSPLPVDAEAAKFAGIMTWFSRATPATKVYLGWANEAAKKGARFVVLGEIGGEFWTDDLNRINALLGGIGLRHQGRFIDITFDAAIVQKPIPFEAKLDPVLPPFPMIASTSDDLHVLLELTAPARDGGGRSILVATSPRGGYAAPGFEMTYEPRLDRVRWLLDPFAFFGRAFGVAEGPRPDPTTLSGRRVFFSQIDGTGISPSAEEADPTIPLQLYLEKIATPYPDIPTSFSVLPEELNPRPRGNAQMHRLVREFWAMPQIEPSIFLPSCRGDRRKGGCAAKTVEHLIRKIDARIEPGREGPPRMEGEGRIQLALWADPAAPSEEAVVALRRLGYASVVAKESRFDPEFPSIAYVAPFARPVGTTREAYVGGDDRSAMEGMDPIRAAAAMRTMLAKTEVPRRLAPYSLYYRTGSLSDPDMLKTIADWLDLIRAMPVAPIRTTDYAAMVQDFSKVRVSRVDAETWAVDDLGAIHTVRFDEAGGRHVDFERSKGVLGETRDGGSLYVSLDADRASVVVALEREGRASESLGLQSSRWVVAGLVRGQCGWTFSASGFGPGEFVWSGVRKGFYDLVATRDGERLWEGAASSEGDGALAFTVPVLASQRLAIDVRCRSDVEGRAH